MPRALIKADGRALLLAAMADGTSRLEGAAFSEDSVHFLKALEDRKSVV